jgi:NifU-like protein involved in Fe-S cluster formation
MNHNALVEKYFFSNTHVGVAPLQASWCSARVGTAGSGEMVAWGMQFDGDRIVTVRYQVKGSVLCVASCALAAEFCEGQCYADVAQDLSGHIVSVFEVPKEQLHVPALVCQAVSCAWMQREAA